MLSVLKHSTSLTFNGLMEWMIFTRVHNINDEFVWKRINSTRIFLVRFVGKSSWRDSVCMIVVYRAVQWHCVDEFSNDTVPTRAFITTNHQALFIYNRTKITGWISVLPFKNVLSHVQHSASEQSYFSHSSRMPQLNDSFCVRVGTMTAI